MKTLANIFTHNHIRTFRSIPTCVGHARGQWSRLRESEAIRRAQRRVR